MHNLLVSSSSRWRGYGRYVVIALRFNINIVYLNVICRNELGSRGIYIIITKEKSINLIIPYFVDAPGDTNHDAGTEDFAVFT